MGAMRATMKLPAVTMVAALINAEIGVGPSMESGNQTCKGIWADLPIAPTNSRMQITVIHFHSPKGEVAVASPAASALLNTVA